MVQLADVWRALVGSGATMPAAFADVPITGTTVDSRAVEPGMLFVALHGEKTDGHLFLGAAFERGAVAALAEEHARAMPGLAVTFIAPEGELERREDGGTRGHGMEQPVSPRSPIPVSENTERFIFVVPDTLAALQRLAAYWRAQMPATVVAITGSVGKTTTKETVGNVLAQRYNTLRSPGNLNNELGLPLTLLQLTPAHERAVLEMGMYDLGEIARLCEIARPRIGIVTNIGPTHLERLRSVERIAEAKSELVRALPEAEDGGVAILNADDPLVRAMAGQTRARVFTYGLSPTSDLWAEEPVSEGLEGIRFWLHRADESLHIHVPMLGRHSVHTALRGAAIGLVEGLSWPDIVRGLQEARGQLRLLVAPGLRDTTIIDDTYNASPVSMLAALNLLRDIANDQHRCIAVLGDMLELGPYEQDGHRVVGGRASQVVSKLITVGARARWIAEAAIATGMSAADVYPVDTNEDATAVLLGLIRAGDVLLVKGSRGQAMESIVDALSRPNEARS